MQTSSIIFIVAVLVALFTVNVEALEVVKLGLKQAGKSTWFNGHDLKAAACYGNLQNKRVDAADDWHIGAVHMKHFEGGDKSCCFQCAKITAGLRSVVVRIIDDCRSCSPTQIDLTSSAFKVLAPLDQGIVDTTFEWVRCPKSGNLKWPSSPSPN
ncbi:hypothetical protein BGZ76_006419 [Entomortierella beljakovae]|nr:hypothetical protein BGZ76_006419 [Entomortierella beljakovae]